MRVLPYRQVAETDDAAADNETWEYYPCAAVVAGIAATSDIAATHIFPSYHFLPFQANNSGQGDRCFDFVYYYCHA